MQTPLITHDPAQAREQLAAYNRQLNRRDDPEYQAIAAGYAELAAGRPLINLHECFLTVPLDEKGRPRLAIARADRRTVTAVQMPRSRVLFDARKNGSPSGTLTIEVEVPAFEGWSGRTWYRAHALVPLIPAAVRAKIPRGTTDAMCHILWEVEQWSDTPLGQQADRDPYLLRHLGGELWAVLAEWDLSPLERAVMAGRTLA
jgi:hypothetical protein